MDGASAPSPAFKKRVKGSIRPSGSTSSLKSLAASPSTAGQAEGAESEEEGTPVIRRTKKSAASKVKDREGIKTKGRLSFGAAAADEEDEEPTFIKRSIDSPLSASSRRLLRPSALAAASSSEVPTSLDQASISSGTPVLARTSSLYSKEHLNELKAATLSTPRSAHAANGDAAVSEFSDLTHAKFGSRADSLDDPSIPTEQAIAEAKKRRERMRAEGVPDGGDGFIGLEVGFASKKGESRLVREDDELGDGDEDLAGYTGSAEILPLGKKANKEAAERMRSGMIDMIQDVADEENEDGEDAEQREWEEAQIRRGEGRKVVTREKSSKRPYKPTPIPRTGTLPSLSLVSTRLSTSLNALTSSLSLDSSTLTHFEREKAELEAQEQELRKEVEGKERRREWFEGFREEMEIVGGFLEEKFPLLEKIEASSLSIASERATLIAARRFADDSDDVSLFTGAHTHTMYPPSPIPIDEEMPDMQDEFGRMRPDEKAPRSEARLARRAARTARRPPSISTEDEGSWTDDELDASTSADLSSALVELRQSLADLFSDVKADNFRDPNLGTRKRFEEWRQSYSEEYQNAFGGLALVGVWEFWGRVEGLGAEIDHQERPDRPSKGLETFHWHQSLTSYGHSALRPPRASSPSAMSDFSDEEGQDESADLINAFVTGTLIPRLSKLARETYDPLSVKATTRALGTVDEVSYCVDRGAEKFETLIQAYVSRIQHLITLSQSLLAPHLALLASPALAFDPSTFTARSTFMSRQVKLLQQALRWRRFARSLRIPASAEGVGHGLLFDELLERELVAKVILPLAEASWGTGGQEIGLKVIAMLPKDGNPALRRRLEGIRD